MEGVHRFLARAWRAFEGGLSDEEATREQLRSLHATIKKVWKGGRNKAWLFRPGKPIARWVSLPSGVRMC